MVSVTSVGEVLVSRSSVKPEFDLEFLSNSSGSIHDIKVEHSHHMVLTCGQIHCLKVECYAPWAAETRCRGHRGWVCDRGYCIVSLKAWGAGCRGKEWAVTPQKAGASRLPWQHVCMSLWYAAIGPRAQSAASRHATLHAAPRSAGNGASVYLTIHRVLLTAQAGSKHGVL